MEKRQYMPAMFSPIDMDAMTDLRRAIDPLELANRGKMFPDDTAQALPSHTPHPLEQAGVISRV
jgi:glycolate oxidase